MERDVDSSGLARKAMRHVKHTQTFMGRRKKERETERKKEGERQKRKEERERKRKKANRGMK